MMSFDNNAPVRTVSALNTTRVVAGWVMLISIVLVTGAYIAALVSR